ncbi:MAG: YafY family transcriptional regulator [Chloroflexi bacterium]|nr:YafY family transcriptional regulator [Chloroflexota bacterium]OJV94675.1 MAG: transcriptional regulator [Chloroflexi bacterium 54-19]
MRADRLLSIMLLLQAHRRLTAGDLARRLEVSERTIHRDMEALGVSGIPVTAERGAGGGWSLLEPYQTNLTGLNEAEIQALFLAKPASLLADLGLNQAAEAALIKLFAALPAFQRQGAEYARQRIYIDTSGWRQTGETNAWLPTLQEAVWEERQVRLVYRRNDDTEVERVVDPLGLVAKGNIWYLVAGVDGEIRSYRVSRVIEAVPVPTPCQRPPDFDLEAYWKASAGQFQATLPVYRVTVRVAPEFIRRLGFSLRFARIEKTGPIEEDGWQEVIIRFQTEQEACEHLLGFGTQTEVVEPHELRERIIEGARATLEFYKK